MIRLLSLFWTLVFVFGHGYATASTKCTARDLARTYQTSMGELQCTAAGNRALKCCYGKGHCNNLITISIYLNGTVSGGWLDRSGQSGLVVFDVSPDCWLMSGKPTRGPLTSTWEIEPSPEQVAEASEPQPAPAASVSYTETSAGLVADQDAGLPSRCSLDDVAEPYMMGSVRLECSVVGQRLQCCEIKMPTRFVRPEHYRSFDPLNPPRRLPRPEEVGYRAVERICGANGLSLELQGDEAVGWKDLSAPPDQRLRVRLPLDDACRLSSGTILDRVEEPLPMRFDLVNADVKSGQPETQYEIGKYWLTVHNSERHAITHFTAAAREGHAQSQYELAKIFEEGAVLVRRNLKEAYRLYALAAAQGLEEAQLRMQRRETVKENLQELVRQAEAGDADKQYNLALLYGTGKVVGLDWEKTVYWLQRASDRGHARAMNDLGWIYARGIGDVKRDEAVGRALLEKSIAHGNDWALVNLARVTYRGEEDVASPAATRARELLNRARQSSDPEVVREANYWLSLLARDRSTVARRNTIESRREAIDAMQRSFQGGADAALDALQNIQ